MSDTKQGAARAGEWVLALLLVAALGALLLPWPRPTADLREACVLEEAGLYAAQCDLEQATRISTRTWLSHSLSIYEDGLPLRAVHKASEVRRGEAGGYHTTGRILTFSSLDRSDPRANDHDYLARPAEWDPLRLATGQRRAIGLVLLALLTLAACLARPRRAVPLLRASAVLLATGALVVQAQAALTSAPIHVDAGSSLPSAEAVLDGFRLYDNLLFNYTPIGVFELAGWSWLWPLVTPPRYSWYMLFVLINEAVCAALVYLVLRRAGGTRATTLLVALCYLSMTLWFDGSRVLFEPLYLVFVLAGAWCVLARPSRAGWLGAGVLSALAFLTKQYGGVGFVGLVGYALVQDAERPRRLLWSATGFLCGLLVFGVLLSVAGVDLRSLLTQASGSDYARRYEATWLMLFLWQCPLAVVALATPWLPGAWSRPAVRLAVSYGLAAVLPFYFRQHQYYFLIPAPWVFVLFGLGVEQLVTGLRGRRRALFAVVAAVLALSIPVRAAVSQAAWFRRDFRGLQLRRGLLMNQAWPAGRRTLVFAYPYFYHVAHYRSADETTLGYRFLNECNGEQLRLGLSRADAAWLDPRGMYARQADAVLRQIGSSLEDELRANHFDRQLVLEGRFELWTKPEPGRSP